MESGNYVFPLWSIAAVSAIPPLLLRNRTGHNFSGYKANTNSWQIERRINLCQIAEPGYYKAALDLLKSGHRAFVLNACRLEQPESSPDRVLLAMLEASLS